MPNCWFAFTLILWLQYYPTILSFSSQFILILTNLYLLSPQSFNNFLVTDNLQYYIPKKKTMQQQRRQHLPLPKHEFLYPYIVFFPPGDNESSLLPMKFNPYICILNPLVSPKVMFPATTLSAFPSLLTILPTFKHGIYYQARIQLLCNFLLCCSILQEKHLLSLFSPPFF